MFGTFSLSVGAAVRFQFPFISLLFLMNSICFNLILHNQFAINQVGMEFWARWAHRALWHSSLWHMHEVSNPSSLYNFLISEQIFVYINQLWGLISYQTNNQKPLLYRFNYRSLMFQIIIFTIKQRKWLRGFDHYWCWMFWLLQQSHHKPREGPFELNDIFAIINAVPAIALLSYGFFHKGLVPGLCFGAVNLWISLSLSLENLSLFILPTV